MTSASEGPGHKELKGTADTKSSQVTANSPSVRRTDSEPAILSLRASSVIYKKRRKKKRRYSSGLKQLQQVERGAIKASGRLARAIDRGLRTYRNREDRSSRKRRDGAIRDGLKNWSRAVGRTLRVASRAPNDFTRRFNSKQFSRQVRDTLRAFSRPLFG
jgi:hypothetical protein